MLHLARRNVHPPTYLPLTDFEAIKAMERGVSAAVGDSSLLELASNDEVHQVLSLVASMDVAVTPLPTPSSDLAAH